MRICQWKVEVDVFYYFTSIIDEEINSIICRILKSSAKINITDCLMNLFSREIDMNATFDKFNIPFDFIFLR